MQTNDWGYKITENGEPRGDASLYVGGGITIEYDDQNAAMDEYTAHLGNQADFGIYEVSGSNGWEETVENLPASFTYYAIEESINGVNLRESLDILDLAAMEPKYTDFSAEGITITNYLPICKIMDGDKEVPFRTLRDALDYAETNMGGTATIEMLVDYDIPASDFLLDESSGTHAAIHPSDNITLTTAATTGGVFYYGYIGGDIENGIATITRKEDGDSLIKNLGTLTLTNITLDGGAVFDDNMNNTGKSSYANGGLIRSFSGSTLNIQTGATLQNSDLHR